MPNQIGERLKKAIKCSQYSQKELSAILQISEDSITRYIQGKQSPKLDILLKMCETLDISIIQLIEGKNAEILSNNETELLQHFRMLPDREQVKIIGITEEKAKEINQEEKFSGSKIG